jgi:hypothetical protein
MMTIELNCNLALDSRITLTPGNWGIIYDAHAQTLLISDGKNTHYRFERDKADEVYSRVYPVMHLQSMSKLK